MLREYKISIAVDNRVIDIRDQVDTNFREGEATQMATLFYRTMLAMGYPPVTACEALGKIAVSNGFALGDGVGLDEVQSRLEFGGKQE